MRALILYKSGPLLSPAALPLMIVYCLLWLQEQVTHSAQGEGSLTTLYQRSPPAQVALHPGVVPMQQQMHRLVQVVPQQMQLQPPQGLNQMQGYPNVRHVS